MLDSKQRPYRFMAAYNLALYYEMTDRIDEALHSLQQAEEFAIKHHKRGGITTQAISTTLLEEYREVLINRKKELELLDEWEKKKNCSEAEERAREDDKKRRGS